jgi:hypothetical protein
MQRARSQVDPFGIGGRRIALPSDARETLISDHDLRSIDDASRQHIDHTRRGHDGGRRPRAGQRGNEQESGKRSQGVQGQEHTRPFQEEYSGRHG